MSSTLHSVVGSDGLAPSSSDPESAALTKFLS